MMIRRIVPLACAVLTCLFVPRSFAGAQIDEILARAGQQVERFWQQLPSFNCRESVTREKVEKCDKVEFKQELEFDYLALTKMRRNGFTIEEVRLPLKRIFEKSDPPPLLETNGFPTLQLIFHPRFQSNYTFRDDGADGGLIRIRFEHIPGAESTSAVMVQEKAYALELHGTVWIDGDTGVIRKIQASIAHPMPEINVAQFSAEVIYTPREFPLENELRWLPSSATIELHTGLQRWRNVHRYSQYKRFSVQAEGITSR